MRQGGNAPSAGMLQRRNPACRLRQHRRTRADAERALHGASKGSVSVRLGGCLVHQSACKVFSRFKAIWASTYSCMGLQKRLSYMCPRQAAAADHSSEVQGNTLKHMLVSSADQPSPRSVPIACSAVAILL